MTDSSEKTIEETNETKELVKKMNVDAVAQLLINMKKDNYKIKSEQADLKHIVSRVTQDIAGLRSTKLGRSEAQLIRLLDILPTYN